MKIQYTALLLTLCCVSDVFASDKKDGKFIENAKDEFKDLGEKISDSKIDLDKYVPDIKINTEDLDKDFHD